MSQAVHWPLAHASIQSRTPFLMKTPESAVPSDIPGPHASRLRAWRCHAPAWHVARLACSVLVILLALACMQRFVASHGLLPFEVFLVTASLVLAVLVLALLWMLDVLSPEGKDRALSCAAHACMPWRRASVGRITDLAALAQSEPWLPCLVADSTPHVDQMTDVDLARLLRKAHAAVAARDEAKARRAAWSPLDAVIRARRAEGSLSKACPPGRARQRA